MKINRFFSDVLGANLKNQRWSWGAVDPIEHRIFLRVWKDEIKTLAGDEYVQICWNDLSTHGAAERREHVAALRGGAAGIGVVCRAVDTRAKGARKIDSYDPAKLIVLGELVDRPDSVWAKIIGRISTEQLSKPRSGQSTLGADVQRLLRKPNLTSTQKEALVKARLGQGVFRYQVLALWKNKCAVTGCGVSEALRASHIKPWRHCTDEERLDASNGLPLTAHLDALFDCGLISFEDSGKLLISRRLSLQEQRLLGITATSLRKRPSGRSSEYLKHHRKSVFRS